MKLAVINPKLDGRNIVPHMVKFSGEFLGLVDMPDGSGGVWNVKRGRKVSRVGTKSFTLAFLLEPGTFPNEPFIPKAWREGGVVHINPMNLVYDCDTPSLLWNPRAHWNELGVEYQGWLASYPEWPNDNATSGLFALAVSLGATHLGSMLGLENPLDGVALFKV